MSNDPQVSTAPSSSIREEMVSRMDKHSEELVRQWKEDEEYGYECSDPELDLMCHVDVAWTSLTQYSEETLVALKDSGMSDDMIASVIYCTDGDEFKTREIAHYYGASGKCSDTTIFNTVREIFAVPDLSQFSKDSQKFDDVSRVLVAAKRFRAERMNKPLSTFEPDDEDEDGHNFGDFLSADLDDEYDAAVMTSQLAKVICDFPDDLDRISGYILNRQLIPSEVDAGHLAECLKAPALALEEGVL